MLIYRMEDNSGLGPFMGSILTQMPDHVPWLVREFDGVSDTTGTHPHHMKDCLGWTNGYMVDDIGHLATINGSTWRVGTDSLSQFYHWFPRSSLSWFASEGYHLAEYDAPASATRRGHYQVMFDAAAAKLEKVEPLTALVKGN